MEYYKSVAFAKLNKLLCGINLLQLSMVTLDELKIIISNINPSDSVLDIGVGMGRVTEYLCAETGADFTGIDIDEGNLNIAKAVAHEKLRFQTADMTNLPFAENTFDAVLLLDSLNFVKDRNAALDGIYKVIKNNGLLCICWSQPPQFPMEAVSHEYSEVGIWANTRNLSYKAFDRTKEHEAYWKNYKTILSEMENEFKAEGLIDFWKQTMISVESVEEIAKSNILARWVYIIEVGNVCFMQKMNEEK